MTSLDEHDGPALETQDRARDGALESVVTLGAGKVVRRRFLVVDGQQRANELRSDRGSCAAPTDSGVAPAIAPGYPRPLDLCRLADKERPEREWFVEGLVPKSANVLLSAHGGTGKSMLALHMAVCIASGTPFFGIPTKQANVLGVFAEDDEDELHRRLAAICRSLELKLHDLEGRLLLFDAVGIDISMYSRHVAADDGRTYSSSTPGTTSIYNWARFNCWHCETEVLILDSASDTFDADENSRSEVRRYMSECLALVLARRGSVIHVAHVDKMAARGSWNNGQTYSGSTAWHNSCRVRLAMHRTSTRVRGEAPEEDGRRVLVVEKTNYGRPGLSLGLKYDEAREVFVQDLERGAIGERADQGERQAILRGLLAAEKAERSVMVARQANGNAAVVLGSLPGFPTELRGSAGRRRLFKHLHSMEAAGLIERERYRTQSRNTAERWKVTAAGRELPSTTN